MIISLLIGYCVKKSALKVDCHSANGFMESFMPVFCGAIDLGNQLYHENKMAGFLHIGEALKILPPRLKLAVETEENLLCAAGTPEQTIGYYIQENRAKLSDLFCVVIAKGIAVSVYVSRKNIVVVDSHSNGQHGGRLCVHSSNDFPNNCFHNF